MDENLLLDSHRAGLFHLPPARRDAFAAAAARAGLEVLSADLRRQAGRDAVLEELGQALHFPAWYGANFDALYDCLTEPDWQPAPGHVLLLSGLGSLRGADPESFGTLLEVLASAAVTRREAGQPFWIMLDTGAPDIPPAPEK